MEDIKIIYDNNIEEIILINYFTSIVEKINKEKGEFILENDILKIKWDDGNYQDFIKNNDINDEIYIYNQILNNNNENIKIIEDINITDNSSIVDINIIDDSSIADNIESIQILHNEWIDNCIIKNNMIFRVTLKEEYGKFKYINNLLIIYWEKWNYEIFFKDNDDIYKLINLNINVHHNDWNDICILNEENLYRKNNKNEFGTYIYNRDKLIINWNNWSPDIFVKLDDEYFHENLIKYIEINNNKYIFHNNNLYDNNIKVANIKFIENNILRIKRTDNINEEDYYYEYRIDNSIKIFKNIYKSIILIKDTEIICNINLITYEIKSDNNKGIYNLDEINNNITIDWNNNSETEIYNLLNDKYYYINYLELNNSDIILITENDKIDIKICIFENYFLTNNNIKNYFLKNNNNYYILINNIINKFYIYNTYNTKLLIVEHLYKKINNINNLNDLNNLNNLSNRDINSFIFSLQNIYKPFKILYDNLYFNIDLSTNINNQINPNNQNNQNNPNNPININNYIKIYDNLTFIINLDNLDYLENILENIPKISNIIINLKYEYNIDSLINNYKNLIIIRSFDNINFYILKYIVENIFKKENIVNCNIFYINTDNNIDDNIIDLSNYKNDNIYYNNSKKYLIKKNNYLYSLLSLINNYHEIILIYIFYYLLQKNIYDICNNNFIINSDLLYRLLDNKFDKFYYDIS